MNCFPTAKSKCSPAQQNVTSGNKIAEKCSPTPQITAIGNRIAGKCSPATQIATPGNKIAGKCSRTPKIVAPGNKIAGKCSPTPKIAAPGNKIVINKDSSGIIIQRKIELRRNGGKKILFLGKGFNIYYICKIICTYSNI